MAQTPPAFWSLPAAGVRESLRVSANGLTSGEARQRLERYGANLLKPPKRTDVLTLLLAQFQSPIILILLFATGLSFFLHDAVDALIILAIVLASGLLGFWQEHGATHAVERLLAVVRVRATALRDGRPAEVPLQDIVPGDVVRLGAGDIVPGDCLIQESRDLFVDEAMLTGETFPVEKAAAVLPEDAPLARRTNALWMGTHVVSGTATALVVRTGRDTEFGRVSDRLRLRPPETEFERGIRRFGYFLMEVTLVLVVAIFAVNVYLGRHVMDSFLFSLALAVGLTPQLLPAIISINLAHGARRMAEAKVIVKRLAAIENFGSMNILCSDKTGTLTQGTVRLQAALDAGGAPSDRVLLHAFLNAHFETGFANPIDRALRESRPLDVSAWRKLDEIPYDFLRKRLSILAQEGDGPPVLVTKGALPDVLEVCATAEAAGGQVVPLDSMRDAIQRRFEEFSAQGGRTLGVACKAVGAGEALHKADEAGMTFLGFLVFFDPPKPGIADTIARLKALGVSLKIITGDNRLVAATVGRQMGLASARILAGPDLRRLSVEALVRQVEDVDVFAEIEPNQKERIILALRKSGHVVGYMGDGINDASALHAADVGISVDGAVDVAKEAADIVLLEHDLGVLEQGVRAGRMTFANTLKYVFMATSANFGNMFSMAGVSLVLPFLPLLPKQILLTNLLTDCPEMTIATDQVDPEMVDRPRRWDIKAIRRFMLTFGVVSSLFDYLTFGALLLLLHASRDQFRTGWFVESVVSAALIVLVIRSRRPFFRSRPGRPLLLATLGIVALALALPYTPLGRLFGFCPLPPGVLLAVGVIVVLYIVTAEAVKMLYYRRVNG